MILWLNEMGEVWGRLFLWMNVQNTLFLVLILILMIGVPRIPVQFRYALGLLGLVKLYIPPVVPFPTGKSLAELPILEAIPNTTSWAQPPESALSVWGGLLAIWVCGVIIFWGWHLGKYVLLQRNLKRFTVPFEHRDAITIYISPMRHAPFACGLVTKKIILPARAKQWAPSLRELVITHELNHFRFQDPWIGLFQMLAQGLYFFHPLVWVLNSYIDLYREVYCDARTIRQLHCSPAEYFKSLLTVAESIQLSSKPSSLRPGLFEPFYQLKKRIQHQFHSKLQEELMQLPARTLYGAMFVFVAILLGIFSCQLSENSPSQFSEQSQASLSEAVTVVPFSALTEKPQLVKSAQPAYPDLARKAGVEGRVIVKALVNEQGRVTKAEVLQGESVLQQAAIEAAQKFVFTPPRKGTTAVSTWVVIPFEFRLNN